jgi:YD repeat-containing protein
MKKLKSTVLLMAIISTTTPASAEDYWGPPYTHNGYTLNGPWPSIQTTINMWWKSYQSAWNMPQCTYHIQKLTPTKENNDALYLLRLTNGCTGGNGIYGTKRDYLPQKNFGPPPMCTSSGNPINNLTGIKFQEAEEVFSSTLHFRRYFNGSNAVAGANMGISWRHEFAYQLFYLKDTVSESVVLFRPNGLQMSFNYSGSQWAPEVGAKGKLTASKGPSGNILGWTFLDPESNAQEIYSADGLLRSINQSGTDVFSFEYSTSSTPITTAPQAGLLIKATNNKGDFIELSYNSTANIAQIRNGAGKTFSYSYDSTGNLISVQHPDSTYTQYLYNEPSMIAAGTPNSLTGIIDQNGVRFATWKYDQQGRGISSEHAGGAEKVTLTYNNDNSTTVTNGYGKKTTYRYQVFQGLKLLTAIEGESSANCPNSNSSFTYDSNGLLKTKTDNKGVLTTYAYNARGLEISRTEASGTAQARTITTDWHPTLFLPTVVTEPKRITTYHYDDQGRQLSRTVEER